MPKLSRALDQKITHCKHKLARQCVYRHYETRADWRGPVVERYCIYCIDDGESWRRGVAGSWGQTHDDDDAHIVVALSPPGGVGGIPRESPDFYTLMMG